VWYNPTSTGPRAFIDAVTAAGFEASLLDEAPVNRGAAEHAAELEGWRQLLVMALVFTVPVFMLAMVLPMMPGESAACSWGCVHGVCS
jgi:Cu+-exporting ATPase